LDGQEDESREDLSDNEVKQLLYRVNESVRMFILSQSEQDIITQWAKSSKRQFV